MVSEEDKAKTELEKPTPDVVQSLRWQNERDRIKDTKAGNQNEDLVWAELALFNLDKRVQNGEADKPA